MTEEQLCNLVLEATGKTEQELPKFRILALARLAIQKLPDVVDALPPGPRAQQARQLLRKDVDVTITAGVGDLTAAKSDTEPIKAEELYCAEIYIAGVTRRCQYAPDKSALEWDRPAGFPFFTVSGNELLVRYNNAYPTTTATIRGTVIRTLANIPVQLQDNFVAIVAFMTTPEGQRAVEAKAATTE